ncbi:MAG: hypothetical protein WBQ94_20435 [Terracidiphilus sp.]
MTITPARLTIRMICWMLLGLTAAVVFTGCSDINFGTKPIVTSFTATPASITSGMSSNLTAVFAGGAGLITPGNIPVTNGAAVKVSPTSTTTYMLTITPAVGSAITQTVTVTVTPVGASPAITSFTASPTSIQSGTSSSLTAVFSGGTGVISPGNISVTSGTAVRVSPAVTTIYTLTVTPTAGPAITQNVAVTVIPVGTSPTIISFTASPASIPLGANSSLNAVFSGGTGVVTPGNITATSGTPISVSPTATTTYTLTVTPATGTAVSKTVIVTVTPVVTAGCPTVTSGAPVGVWEDITPAVFLTPSNMQTASVVVDPLNPTNVYASAGNNTNGGGNSPTSTGVYKSTDCGAHWAQVSTRQNSAAVNSGLLWEMKFDASGANLYVSNGYGAPPALFKSSNHGVDWSNLFAGKSFTLSGDTKVSALVPLAKVFTYSGFVQAFSIDSTDPTQQHIVSTFHENCFDGVPAAQGGWGVVGADPGILCLGETLDGGATWRLFPGYSLSAGWQEAATVTALGSSRYLHITPNGVYYTADGGETWQQVSFTADGGTTWNPIGAAYAAYGEGTYLASDGTLYLGTSFNGILYSKTTPNKALGASQNWAQLANSQKAATIISDGVSLYAGWGIFDNSGQPFWSAPLSNLTDWTHMSSPSNPANGPNEFAYDPVDHVIYAASYSGGLLRLVTQAPTGGTTPSITSFTASPTTIATGTSSSLTAVFTGGAGVITPGNISVTSGTAVSVSPGATTTYTLTVTPTSGSAITQTVTVTVTVSGGTTITDKLGKPDRVLIGLGSLDESKGYAADLQSQGVASNIVHNPDIVDQYIVGFGSGSWPYWNGNGDGSYVNIISEDADAIGAVPMVTLYQMAQNGDGNISWINQSGQMDTYWANVRLMFKRIAIFGKPTLVNLEPDFWGYVELKVLNSGNDPATVAASVNDQPECSSQPNNVTGLAACILAMGRQYAPNALIGFQPSFFGEDSQTLAAFMSKLGAQNADFTVAETYDRDAGCYEEALQQPTTISNVNAASVCSGRGNGPFYYDETNKTGPNFSEEIGNWSTYRNDLGGNLPLIWWQTPMGVPSLTPGGTDGHYRDNHVDYMLKNSAQYADIGTFGIVFSGGASYQTSISTDGGEFAILFDQYLSAGGVVPVY